MIILAQAFPGPIDVTAPARGIIGGVVEGGAGGIVNALGGWVFASLSGLAGAVFGLADTATQPDVTSRWFIDGSTGTGPYRAVATVAATIMCVLVFGGVVQGIVQADVGGMVRRMVLQLPLAVAGIGGTVVVVQILIELTDAIARYLTSTVGADTQAFVTSLGALATATGQVGAPMLVLAVLMLVAAVVVFLELLVRSLLIYLIVALCPLAWAALVWPALQGALRKTLELLVAVILSKVVVALALAVGAAAFTGALSAGETSPQVAGYRYAPPGTEAQPEPPAEGKSLAQQITLIATGVATMALAAFSPFLLVKLLPFAEAAVVAQGTRGSPLRVGQQVSYLQRQLNVTRKLGGGAGGPGGSPAEPGPPGPASGAGSGGSTGSPGKSTAPAAGAGTLKPSAVATGGAATGPGASTGGTAAGGAKAGAGASGGAAAAGPAAAVAAPVMIAAAVTEAGKKATARVEGSVGAQASSPSGERQPSAAAPTDAGESTPHRPASSTTTLDRLGQRPGPGGSS